MHTYKIHTSTYIAFDPAFLLLEIYATDILTHGKKDVYTRFIIAGLFTKGKGRKQPEVSQWQVG